MLPRAQLIAVLVAVEFAIIFAMGVAIRGDQGTPWSGMGGTTFQVPGTTAHLDEGGPFQVFSAGAHPAVTIDIGWADLTIGTGSTSEIKVSVSKSSAFGPFRAKSPITATQSGGTVHVAVGDDPGWVIGDNRMVTVILPPDTEVTVINAGDIRAAGLRAVASFKSNNGDIRIDDYNAPRLTVEATRNGDVTLNQIVASHLDVSSSNGDVEGTDLQVRDGRIASHDGSVKLGFAPGTDAMVTAQAGGRVRVSGFPATASVAPSGSSSGNDDNDDASLRTVRVGAGNGRINVNSGSDDIDLSQEG
jgi:hypothetical protein